MLITNSYRKLERIIAGFVSLIALAYLIEVNMVNVDWAAAGIGWVDPKIPNESMLVILSILGAVIMPHNLFLHSEIIQSRQFNTQDPSIMKRQLRYEFLDTLFSMGDWVMIKLRHDLLAAAVFFTHGIEVTELEQAEELLHLSLALQQVLSLLSHCSLRALPLLLQQVWQERVYLQACLVSLTI